MCLTFYFLSGTQRVNVASACLECQACGITFDLLVGWGKRKKKSMSGGMVILSGIANTEGERQEEGRGGEVGEAFRHVKLPFVCRAIWCR